VKGGRCEACQGDGLKRIEMNFLPDVYVTCDVCRGRRYNRETLQVKFKGYSIADLLDATVEDALPLMENLPQIRAKLETLHDVGWGMCTSANLPPRFPAAKRSASSWQGIEQAADRPHLLSARRAHHRVAFRRRAQTAGRAPAASRIGQHGSGDRAQPGRDQNRRLDHRPGPGWRRIRWPRGGLRHTRQWRARRKVTPRRRCAECWAKEWRHEPVHEATARFRRVAHGWAARARRQNQDCGLRVAVRQGIRHGACWIRCLASWRARTCAR